jgi:Fe-S cluster biogenesis protein NfuA
LFIQTEETPNPESLKFLPGRAVLDNPDGTGFYATAQDQTDIAKSPLAQELFKLDGVKSVYFGNDFVTVTKYAEATWQHLRLFVFEALMDFFATNKPVLKNATSEVSDTTILDTDDEVVAMIKELLEARIRPAVQEDGGDIRFVGFDAETGIVSVKLAGSCVGCPSSSVTLKNGVENMMMHYIPEVTAVVSIDEEEEGNGDSNVSEEAPKAAKTYEERLAAAGIPFSD